MNKVEKHLRWWIEGLQGGPFAPLAENVIPAADEIARLEALNAELLAACEFAVQWLGGDDTAMLESVIAKCKEQK